MLTQIEIGRIKILGRYGSTCPIEVWPNYGITCYELGTLNGSITAIATNLSLMYSEQELERKELSDDEYEVVIEIDGYSLSDFSKENLETILRKIYSSTIEVVNENYRHFTTS